MRHASWAWELVRTSGFGDAIATYPSLLSSRSEFGVLATVNVKAVVYRMPLRIGQYADIAGEFQTKGLIDEVRIYLRPLSTEEIRKEATN